MTYDGKRLEEMTGDELEAAEAYVVSNMAAAERHYRLNRAAYQEIAEEQSRRLQRARRIN